MVFLALTRSGLEQLVSVIGHTPSPLWVNDGVLAADEREKLRATGVDLTNFTSPIAPEDRSAVAGAVDTIAEHHPGQSIWVEYVPSESG